MGSRRKKEAVEYLTARDLNGLADWASRTPTCLRTLFSLTYDPDLLTRWRAIEGIGVAALEVSSNDLEKIRSFVRGLFWLMNDESGGIGWHAPESIAEVCYNVPILGDEYAGLLPSYLNEEPFEEGTHAALARLAPLRKALVLAHANRLLHSLKDPNPKIRAFTGAALRHGDPGAFDKQLLVLESDLSPVEVYDFDSGNIVRITAAELAATW